MADAVKRDWRKKRSHTRTQVTKEALPPEVVEILMGLADQLNKANLEMVEIKERLQRVEAVHESLGRWAATA